MIPPDPELADILAERPQAAFARAGRLYIRLTRAAAAAKLRAADPVPKG
jgi:hypothetical protein